MYKCFVYSYNYQTLFCYKQFTRMQICIFKLKITIFYETEYDYYHAEVPQTCIISFMICIQEVFITSKDIVKTLFNLENKINYL